MKIFDQNLLEAGNLNTNCRLEGEKCRNKPEIASIFGGAQDRAGTYSVLGDLRHQTGKKFWDLRPFWSIFSGVTLMGASRPAV